MDARCKQLNRLSPTRSTMLDGNRRHDREPAAAARGLRPLREDRPLVEAVAARGRRAWAEQLASVRARLLGGEPLEWGRLANENPPELRTHDRFGDRIDEVEFHPAWHALLAARRRARAARARPGASRATARTSRGRRSSCSLAQVEAGLGCPISMTLRGRAGAARASPTLAAEWEPLLTSLEYDPGLRPPAEKRGALCGMAMTEKQGGSDVRANTTRRAADRRRRVRAHGHKWFCSAPMCDAFLVLAQAPDGLSCFLVPRVLPDGTRNALPHPAAEGQARQPLERVERDRARRRVGAARRRGGPRRARRSSRWSTTRGSTACSARPALMRRAVAEATHHAAHRSAFGRLLADQPLMQNVLADLCVESEAATLHGAAARARLRRRADDATRRSRGSPPRSRSTGSASATPPHVGRGARVPRRQRLRRGVGPAAPLPREPAATRSGRARATCIASTCCARSRASPRAVEAFLAEVELAAGADARLDAAARARSSASSPSRTSGAARRLVERMALALQGSLLVRHGAPAVADAFCASRLGGDGGRASARCRAASTPRRSSSATGRAC